MNEVKILVLNVTDAATRPASETQIASLLDDGWEIVNTHADFEISAVGRVALLIVVLKKFTPNN